MINKCLDCFTVNEGAGRQCICCNKENPDLHFYGTKICRQITALDTPSKERLQEKSSDSLDFNAKPTDLTSQLQQADCDKNGSRFSFGVAMKRFKCINSLKSSTKFSTPTFGSQNFEENSHFDEHIVIREPLAKDKHFATGLVYTWGSNDCDQLPVPNNKLNDTGAMPYPYLVTVAIDKLSKQQVFMICCGSLHTVALLSDGSLVSWGCNDDGALGRGKEINERIPGSAGRIINFPKCEKFFSISCGDSHSAAISLTGICYAWGSYRDSKGCIGFPYMNNGLYDVKKCVYFPHKINLLYPCIKVVSGDNHTSVLCYNEVEKKFIVYLWGNNEFGQLGKEPEYSSEIKESYLQPQKTSEKIVNVYCGKATTFFEFRKSFDSLKYYAVGRNSSGELGIGFKCNSISKPKEIKFFRNLKIKELTSCQFASVALDVDGNIYTWGNVSCLGEVEENDRSIPKSVLKDITYVGVGSDTIYVIGTCNTIYAWGEGQMFQIGDGFDYNEPVQKPIPLTNVFENHIPLSVSGGSQHAVALISNNKYLEKDSPLRQNLWNCTRSQCFGDITWTQLVEKSKLKVKEKRNREAHKVLIKVDNESLDFKSPKKAKKLPGIDNTTKKQIRISQNFKDIDHNIDQAIFLNKRMTRKTYKNLMELNNS